MRAALAIALVAIVAAATHDRKPAEVVYDVTTADVTPDAAAMGNISARYECNSNCTADCTTASIPQDSCFFVPPAHSYIRYTCMDNGTKVHLEVYGPFKSLCNDRSKLHLSLTYPSQTCVLPLAKAGGYTEYHCPENGN